MNKERKRGVLIQTYIPPELKVKAKVQAALLELTLQEFIIQAIESHVAKVQ